MRLPYLFEELFRPHWTDYVIALVKISFFGLVALALIKFLLP